MLRTSLQTKFVVTFVTFIIVMVTLILMGQRLVLMPIFKDLEKEFVNRDMERVIRALQREEDAMVSIVSDWSYWDDTYRYAIEKQQDYEEGNLNAITLKNLGINLVFFYTPSGQVVWGKGMDTRQNQWIDFADFPGNAPPVHDTLLKPAPSDASQSKTGLIMTEHGLLLVTASPILTSLRTGEPRGTLVFGRLLIGNTLEQIRKVAGVDFEVLPATQLDTEQRRHLGDLNTAGDPVLIREQSPETLEVWRSLAGLDGKHEFVIRILMPREIFQSAYTGLWRGLGLVVGSMILLMLAMMVLTHWEIVTPVLRMAHHLIELRITGDYDQAFQYQSRDELGRLARCLNDLLARVSEQSNQLKDLSYEDMLTGVANRRSFNDHFKKAWEDGIKTGKPLSLILCDIDQFKLYNDFYGHLQGDQCLRDAAQTLQRAANKKRDLVARFGGEEFVILLPDTSNVDAPRVAERMRQEVLELNIEHARSTVLHQVTLSLGVATVIPNTEFTPESLLHAADAALYHSKTLGRNRVTTHSGPLRRTRAVS